MKSRGSSRPPIHANNNKTKQTNTNSTNNVKGGDKNVSKDKVDNNAGSK